MKQGKYNNITGKPFCLSVHMSDNFWRVKNAGWLSSGLNPWYLWPIKCCIQGHWLFKSSCIASIIIRRIQRTEIDIRVCDNDHFWFNWGKSFLKTMLEKEKMLVHSIFSFSNNVFYPVKDRCNALTNTFIVICKCFQYGPGSLIDCMVFNVIFNSITVISQWPMHLPMLPWSSFNK